MEFNAAVYDSNFEEMRSYLGRRTAVAWTFHMSTRAIGELNFVRRLMREYWSLKIQLISD